MNHSNENYDNYSKTTAGTLQAYTYFEVILHDEYLYFIVVRAIFNLLLTNNLSHKSAFS